MPHCTVQLHQSGRWQGNDGGRPDWARVLDAVCDFDRDLRGPRRERPLDRVALARGLIAMVPALRAIASDAEALGIEPMLRTLIKPQIEAIVASLESIDPEG